MKIGLLAVTVVGCAYHPGSFTGYQADMTGEHATAGCFDIAVKREPDTRVGAVLDWTFANRCDHSALVYLPIVRAIGRTREGTDVKLFAFDPDDDMRALPLGGRWIGNERLEYRVAGRARKPVTSICVDVAGLANVAPAQWHCFGWPTPITASVTL